MSVVETALKRPYTVVAALILVSLVGIGAALRMPVDIFPEIDIPVVAVVWTYNGMSATDIQNRILTLHERQLASLVDDISRIEAVSYQGVGVEKIYLHEGADVTRAVSQLASSALVVLKYMPPNITPPLVLRYGATDVPIIQLSLSSKSLPDTKLNDLGQNIIRPALAVVHGAEVPYPYGGKPRVIMADLDIKALQARGLSPADVSVALQRQNVILPSGDVKIGDQDYSLAMNNSPDVIDSINAFPIKQIDGRTVFMRDVAHVHDGFQVQTNSVSVNGTPGALMSIRKTGGVSTLAVIDGVRAALVDIQKLLPADVSVKALFDQSIFVRAALHSVLLSAGMAAGLTALVIILFLGNVRLSVIILAAIPLSIIAAVLFIKLTGQTLNTMTLGGFALAIGILVDNGTVVIENIERHVAMREPLHQAIVTGANEVAIPTFLSTLCICIVFVPVFLLEGTAKYLFSPLSLSVIGALLASLALSFTMVPVLFAYLMRGAVHEFAEEGSVASSGSKNAWVRFQAGFERGFERFREAYRETVSWALSQARLTVIAFLGLIVVSALLFPLLGRDFFPQVDAGQMRLHVRAPAGTRLEQTQQYFAEVEAQIRQLVGSDQIDVMLDNIGLPYSGINIALSDSATVGPMDGEILISLTEKHDPTAKLIAMLRQTLPRRFPALQFFFQPADIVDQVLNFGQPAPIDVRISGPNQQDAFDLASKIARSLTGVAGVVDSHVFQVPNAPALTVDLDRTLAGELGVTQQEAADNVLVATNSSAQTAPNFWIDPRNSVSYPLVVQVPTYRIDSTQDLEGLPVSAVGGPGQLLRNLASFGRTAQPLVASQLNIRPVFDVHADVQGRDLYSAAADIDRVLRDDRPDASKALTLTLSGQVETMRESYQGLFTGIALAIVLVYLFLVMNFQSWIDPLIVLMAVPFALAGVLWMLFLTQTPMSVPALMGTLMCIGLTTANSILVVSFANQRMAAGDDPLRAAISAGHTRLRPVLMTASAMILGMVPMALGIGEGGEQNAPLGRAVIGGLLFATLATLVFVPTMYRLLRRRRNPLADRQSEGSAHATA
jgi:multidrug efflux pump subunit AcrB